ncbi:MAG: multidrug transporter [Bacteroidetes bacterium]|nr:MAG: multidrug transporter [Bacteroidota bacterium]
MAFGFIRAYGKIEKPIMNVIIAEFFIQLVNATFMNLQPLYMKAEGYSDASIADFISWRFGAVFLLAFPLGLFIKGRKVKNWFYLSAAGVPFFALLIIYATHVHDPLLLKISQALWGVSFTFMQIPVLPFILRNSKKETQTLAISLSYSTWSLAGIFSASIVWALNSADPLLFSERNMLTAFTLLAFAGIFFVARIRMDEKTSEPGAKRFNVIGHDWKLIGGALIPSLVLAIGAGLTIPFINLFFSRVHHLDTSVISVWNFVAAALVAAAALFVPRIKELIGYKIAIPATQSFAVISLALLATTEYYSQLPIAVYIAIGCYLLRQPLMNMAGPMTSEVAMKYVGKRNQEITSALTSAIWSGSWFVGARFVKSMRGNHWPFVHIFLITAGLYAVGVALYYILILAYNRREKAGLIETDD